MIDKLIIGYTTKEHLLLDLDETTFYKVLKLSLLLIKEYVEIGNILILESSTPSKQDYTKFDAKGIPQFRFTYQNFHIVTDNNIGFDRCLNIIDTLVDLDILQKEYKEIRMFRGDMTLRTSAKPLVGRIVPPPIVRALILNRKCSRHDGKIMDFCDFLTATSQALYNTDLYKCSDLLAYMKQQDTRIMEKKRPDFRQMSKLYCILRYSFNLIKKVIRKAKPNTLKPALSPAAVKALTPAIPPTMNESNI